MFANETFFQSSQRVVCLVVSMLIVSSVLALGAFGIESMVQDAYATQVAAATVQA